MSCLVRPRYLHSFCTKTPPKPWLPFTYIRLGNTGPSLSLSSFPRLPWADYSEINRRTPRLQAQKGKVGLAVRLQVCSVGLAVRLQVCSVGNKHTGMQYCLNICIQNSPVKVRAANTRNFQIYIPSPTAKNQLAFRETRLVWTHILRSRGYTTHKHQGRFLASAERMPHCLSGWMTAKLARLVYSRPKYRSAL